MTRKFLIVPLALGAVAMGAAGAQAQIVGLGNSSQSNNQSSETNQAITQNAGGGIVLGGGDQNAANNSDTSLNNSQTSGGGLIVGDTKQSSTQAAKTNQGIDQDASGGTLTLIGGNQNAANGSTT